MPELRPFKGIRYNPELIGNFADVICQPYDQITDDMEREYKRRSPYNYVRLVLTKYAEGHDRKKEYADAKRYLEQWLEEKILMQDEKEAIYPYWQEFSIHDKNYLRKGFICLTRLEELGKGNILPHEKTLSKPKEDRLNLLRTTKKDLEPVFLLYTDEKNYVNGLTEETCSKTPLIEVTDDKKVCHKVWSINDARLINKVTKALKQALFVIADGHHRYETAWTYLNELRNINENHPANFKLLTLVNIEDPGLVILPTHRLIKNLSSFNLGDFLEKSSKYFEIKKTDRTNITKNLSDQKSGAFGFYSKQTAYIIKLKSNTIMKKILPDRSSAYQDLDVAILHTLLIEKTLSIEPSHIENHVRYERGTEETMKKVDTGEFQFSLLMNATRPEQVKEVAENKERMPQKSTDFFPKLVSGLVSFDIG